MKGRLELQVPENMVEELFVLLKILKNLVKEPFLATYQTQNVTHSIFK